MSTQTCDVLVAGSGAGAFAAALTARLSGLDVLMVEKEPVFGGTTCYSAGVIWIPGNSHARRAGIADSPEDALTYLRTIAGNHLDIDRATAFCSTAAEMLDYFERNTYAQFGLAPTWADYEPDLDGGSKGGRSLVPEPFDGRRLGDLFRSLRPPLATMTLLGGMMIGRNDLPHLFKMTRSPQSALHVAGMVARHAQDRLKHTRGTRLTNGNGLIAALALTAVEKGIPLWLEAPLLKLTLRGGRVTGATVRRQGEDVRIEARRGVVLACGGFPGDEDLKSKLYGHMAAGQRHQSVPPASNSGDGIRVGRAVGGAFHDDVAHPAAWTPVSLVPNGDGTTTPFPHFIDRGKPGIIAVDRRGRRFVNESKSYHVFVPAMIEACRDDKEIASWIIADHKALRRFGLGAVPPYPGRIAPYLKSGYLKSAATPEELARQIGVDPLGLLGTIRNYNAHAARGVDPAFGRGTDAYQRFNGAPDQKPNPCVAPLETGPYYAVKLIPGDIGTFAGLRTDASARVVDHFGQAIPGLYAAGNDAASVMGGTYPGGGITIGPALTFGYIAGKALAT